ncbi:MAG TPA: polysaccharide deacetylase [Paenibacillus sp.]|jgi:peptidoglycan/xylan/chitin deacetylase (PgdA/CDA1 family)
MRRRFISSFVVIPILFVVLVFAVSSLLISRQAGIMEASANSLEQSGSAQSQTVSPRGEVQNEAHEQQIIQTGQGVSTVNSGSYVTSASPELDSDKAATAALLPTQAQAVMPKSDRADKIVYLTFDDGPSNLTDQVLGILKKEDVSATFFILGENAKKMPEVITRIVEAGHTIGNHTYNHEYSELYQSFNVFWGQIKETEEVLREITGVRPELVRAPGGTYDHFDKTYFDLLEQAGYKVFDWDVDSGDSKRKGVPAAEILRNSTPSKLKNQMIVLMHDGAGHAETVKALPGIIDFYKKQGYVFRTLSAEQPPVQFPISNKMKRPTRTAPSQAWIENHIVPNAALFGPGLPLYVEAGSVRTKLAAGEYDLQGEQYQVPLRAVMERLGAKVTWDHPNRSAVVTWGDSKVIIDTIGNTIMSESDLGEGKSEAHSISLTSKNGAIWVPLRSILEATGHPILSTSSTTEERLVKAS